MLASKFALAFLLMLFLTQISEAKKHKPEDAHSMRMREIRRHLKSGKPEAVRFELESMTRNDPGDAEAWQLLSKVYMDMDFSGTQMGKALDAAKKAVEAAPNNSTCLKGLAEIYARMGKFKEAMALLDKAVAQKSVDPFCYKSRALILSETKHDKEALVEWQKFEALNPNAKTSYNSIDGGALIYARAGRTDEAVALYDRLQRIRPSFAWTDKKAEAYVLGGRLKEAIDEYSKVLVASPDNEMALLGRARIYSKLGRDKDALADMNLVIKEMPTSSMFLERAHIYEKLGNAEMAKRDRAKAREL
ncbi:MAG: hypothetical protein C0469_01385 [Cyanobacteria bacterium DS2.3.42]|nr:hypothetical protein [Cyanobacteria bacterium DS2.3.42]